jgi:hypothetical protein
MKSRSSGTQPKKAGKRKKAALKITAQQRKRFFIIGAGLAGLALLVFLILVLTRPKLLWYVDEGYSADWNRILRQSSPPFTRNEVVSRISNDSFPKNRFGYVVSTNGPRGRSVEGTPVHIFRDLTRTRTYDNWLALALDPWMVFRKHQDPEPDISFLDINNDRGRILLAGSDKNAVQAWLCQLLQERPEVFLGGDEIWREKSNSLVRDYPFQNGAINYSWVQVWPMVFRSAEVSLYAPLSQARSLNPFRMGLLDATSFPIPDTWERYGLQAEILWARQYGSEKQRNRMTGTERWLRDSRTQTIIANTLNWIPAHPSGIPYNTISWETQMAWLRSSYIWQGTDDALDS